MKKLLVVLLSLTLVMTAFAGCGKEDKKVDAKAKTAKTGLAIISKVDAKSKDAGEKDGLAQTGSTVAAVLVNADGVIVDCIIDAVQTKINFSTTGEITTDFTKVFASKHDLGEEYGMKKASPIGKEWNEQAEALTNYVIGKTIEEVKGIVLADGYTTNEDLVSSVTMSIGEMLAAVEKAVGNAQELGAKTDDKLGLGVMATLGKSKNVVEDADGVAQAYAHYGVVTLNEKGIITSSIVDASQVNIKFSKEGVITSDLTAELKTKMELGDDYGMKKASPIGKEWFEQSKSFTDYITGKTIADVTGIALTEGSASDSDLASSVTMTISDFLTVIENAGSKAK